MEKNAKSRHIWRKAWYTTAIVLSGIILLMGVAGIIGGLVINPALSRGTVSVLQIVVTSTGSMRQIVQGLDSGAQEISQLTRETSRVSQQISQNVQDKGLVATLLPEEKEKQLQERIAGMVETLKTVHEALSASVELYQAVSRIPFINLPPLSKEQSGNIEAAVKQEQKDIQDLKQSIQEFRAGAGDKISQVRQAADQITAMMEKLSGDMKSMDTSLKGLQELIARLQKNVPTVFTILTAVNTLVLAYVVYTQVEMMRLVVRRWKQLNAC